jgi:hypothetical protein
MFDIGVGPVEILLVLIVVVLFVIGVVKRRR